MTNFDRLLMFIYVANIVKLTYYPASKFNEAMGWLSAIIMLLTNILT